MKSICRLCARSVLLSVMIVLATQGAIKHGFVAIDEGLGNLLYVNENDTTLNWIVSIGRSAPRDMQLVGNNRILIGHTNGFTEYDLTTGAVKREVLTYDSVSSVRRLANGQTIIVGVDLAGSKGVVMLKLDSNNVQIKKTVFPGTYVRLVRQTKTNTFLFACNDTIKEADTNGNFIWQTYIADSARPANKHMWKAVRLDNGNIFLSGGYGAFMAEVNSQGTIVREFGEAPQPVGVNPYFYGMFQLLTNDDCVVANWQGHGAGHDTAGKQIELLEFDPSGTIVWSWNKPAIISSLQGVLVLDSLNTSLVYDDRNGFMSPLNAATSVSSGFQAGFQSGQARHTRYPSVTAGGNRLFDAQGRTVGEQVVNKAGCLQLHRGPGVYILKEKTNEQPSEFIQP